MPSGCLTGSKETLPGCHDSVPAYTDEDGLSSPVGSGLGVPPYVLSIPRSLRATATVHATAAKIAAALAADLVVSRRLCLPYAFAKLLYSPL